MGHSLFAELKRRNVFKAGVAYVALGWVVTQVTATVAPALHLPDWMVPVVLWIGVIGFPFVIMFSWVYEITPEGLKRESEVDRSASITHVTGRRMDYLIGGLLVLAIGFTAFDRYVPHRSGSATSGEATVPAAVSTGTSASPVVPAATPAAPAANDNSIAVLPFVDMSPAKDQEYFSDGITEELLNLLAKVPQLQVTARTSSFSFKGKELGIKEIAKTLGVAHILEGSVRKSGNQVRITAQLINAATDKHLWSETYDRKLDDVFAIQDEISAKVVEQLKVTLLGAAPKARTTDPQAYALYLRAVQVGRQATSAAYSESDSMLEKVLAIDPHYAPAWLELARNALNEGVAGLLSDRDSTTRARAAVTKALDIDPDYAAAHATLGYIDISTEHLEAAVRHFERALAIGPADLDVLHRVATSLAGLGRTDEALAIERYVVRRDPVNVSALFNLGLFERNAGRLDDAVDTFHALLSLSPARGGARAQLGIALVLKGEAAAALPLIEQDSSEFSRMVALPIAYHALGRKADSDAALASLIGKYEKDAAFNIAYVYAFRGEPGKTFEWLDKALAYEDSGLSEILQQRLFEKVRSDPRWLPFLRKLGRAPEQLAKVDFKVTLPAAAADVASGGAAR